MDKEIKVSIICNVYNHGPYVRDALEGFVSQKTDFAFEVLIHDDASTDNSADIIREYEEKYPDIIKPIYQTVNQYSQHVQITRTFQSPRVKGKYVAFCEGDDYWMDPLKLQKQYDFLEAHPDYSMCVCSTVWLDMRTGKVQNLCRVSDDCDVSLEDIILETKGRPFQFATFFMNAEIYLNRPSWVGLFGVGDAPLAMYAATCGKIRMLADPMAVYRNRAPGSWTSHFADNPAFKVSSYNKMIAGLNAFNEATNFAYDAVISLRIKRLKYYIARTNRDLKALRSEELREIYNARSFRARMSDVLLCKAPKLQAFLVKLLK